MGAVLQTAGVAELAAELTCCACSSICGLAARDSATRAKFRYCSFLLLATVTCVIAMIPGLRAKLDKIPNLCTKVVTADTCDKFVGFDAVYRIIFAMTAFHLVLALLTLRVTRVKSFRARFNNGLWMFKLGLIFGLTFATFYIPKRTGFFRIWMYLSLTGGFVFVMFQIILVIDFGHSWSLTWAEKLETGHTKLWYVAMAIVTMLMFSVSFGAIIAFYNYFTHPTNLMKCNANFFYISFMGLQCLVAVAVSVTPSVQNNLPGAGLLQSSIVVLYALYLTWNTLSSEPDSSCNPLGNIILEYDSFTGVSGGAIFGCLLTLILLFFACTVRTSTSHLGRYGLALAESDSYAMATLYEDRKKISAEEVRVEDGSNDYGISLADYVGYNYSFFHVIMSLASLHILMVLTNWHSPEENSSMKTLVKNWPSVWVQMASSFACILMYIWFLVTPLVKRVWGPTFGINFNETVIYEKNMKANLMSFDKSRLKRTPSPKQPIITEQPVARDQKDNVINEQREKVQQEKMYVSVNSFVEPPVVYKQKDEKKGFGFDTMSSLNSSFKFPSINQKSKLSKQVSLNKLENEKYELMSERISRCNLRKRSCNNTADFQTVPFPENADRERNLRKRIYKNTDALSNVSTSTKRNQFYDYRNRRRVRNRRFLRSGCDAVSNGSIESMNSWVSKSYRKKYKPLRCYEQRDSDDVIPEEDQTSPIEGSACESQTHRKVSGTKLRDGRYSRDTHHNDEIQTFKNTHSVASVRTNQKTHSRLPPSSLTVKIRKSSHPSEISKTHDEDVDDYMSNNITRPQRRRRKFFKRFRKRGYDSRNYSQASVLDAPQHRMKTPLLEKLPCTSRNHSLSSVPAVPEHRKKSSQRTNTQNTSNYRKTLAASFCLLEDENVPRSFKNSVTREELAESKVDEELQNAHERRSLGLDPMTQNELSIDEIILRRKFDKMTQMSQQDISLVPSIFKHKVQDIETASKILKLQWKILRTQAKIVKIQERIFKLQNPDEDTGMIRPIKPPGSRNNTSDEL